MPNIKQIQLPNENIYDILDANALHTSELKSTTKGTVAASDKGNTANKEYAVGYDKNGKLSVNIPWTDNNTTYTGSDGVTLTGTNFTNSGVRSIATGSSNGNISVNTNGTTADVPVKGLKSAAYKDVTNTYSSTGTDPVSGTAVASALTSLAPMVYKGTLGTSGTITTLPTAAAGNKGYVYNVITAGTYASQTAKVGDMFISNGSNWVLVPSGDEASGTVTSVATGAGLTGGTITTSGTIKANLKSETASTLDSAAMGSTSNRQYAVGVDKSGYLSVNIPWTDTNTKVTSVGNHYAPTADANAELSVDASGGSSAVWDTTNMVTGVNLQRDAKGHVVGVTVDSIKMPPNPNTDNDTKVTQTATSTSADYEVLFSETADNTTRTEGARKNNNLKFNPSTGNLQATQLNGVAIGSSPKFTDTDTKVTAVGNHYTPATVSGQDKSANASGATAAWGIDVVKGVTLNTDGKGHVTGISVTSGKVPSAPTDTKNTAGSTDTSSKIFLIGATSQAANPQTYSDNEVYATSGVLTTKSVQVGGTACTMQYNNTTQSLDFVFA